MAKNDSAKGNPAHKRIGNVHRKAYRKTLWARQERVKDARRTAQAEREAVNNERRQHGDKTAWEISKHNRLVKRANRRKAEAGAARFN